MAAPSKKRDGAVDMVELENEENEDEDNSDLYDELVESDGSDTDESIYGKVQVDFVARTAEDVDSPGIQNLLQQQAEFADDEADDDDADDQESVLGVISVINLTHNKGLDFVKQLIATLRQHCQSSAPSLLADFDGIVNSDDQHVGFIVNERIINLPPQISPPSFDALSKEMDKAKTKKMNYAFNYFLLISKTYRLGRQPKKGCKKSRSTQQDSPTFVNAEEELFFKAAHLSFEYSVKDERDTGVDGQWDRHSTELEPTRTVSIVSADRLPAILAEMSQLYAVSNS